MKKTILFFSAVVAVYCGFAAGTLRTAGSFLDGAWRDGSPYINPTYASISSSAVTFTANPDPGFGVAGWYYRTTLNVSGNQRISDWSELPDSGEKKSSALDLFFSGPTQMMMQWDSEQILTGFRYLPPKDGEGTITHYTLSASTDWTHWTELASGEFSNVVNNPVWQTVTFPPTPARMLKFDADRLASGERMGYEDIEVIKE